MQCERPDHAPSGTVREVMRATTPLRATPVCSTSLDRSSLAAFLRAPRWSITAAVVVAGVMGLRAWILFRSAVPPGVDAGYYPLQSRTLLEQGRLAYDDVPIRFAIDAAIAKTLMLVSGQSIDDATLWASRFVDAVTPPLLALAIFLAGFVWSRGRSSAILGVAAASLLAVASRPIIDMTGDFEKQSLAFVWTAFAWIATWSALAAPDRRRAVVRSAWAVVFLGLMVGTHVGTFGGAAVGAGCVIVAWALLGGASLRRGAIGVTLLLAMCAVAFVGMWLLAPAKAIALLSSPRLLWSQSSEINRGPMGGPWLTVVRWTLPLLAVVALSVGVVRRIRKINRAEQEHCGSARADGAFAIGMLATAALLLSPLLPGEYAMRVGLIAVTPIALVLTFLFCWRVPRAKDAGPPPRGYATVGAMLAVVIAGGSIASAIGGRVFTMPPMISQAGLDELRGWRDELGTTMRCVVVGRHGLEWWAGFGMHSAVRLGQLKESDFDRYERRYILVERHPMEMGGPDGPPNDGPGRRRPRESGPGGPGGMMRLGPIPAGAFVLREGDVFTLYEVPMSSRDSLGKSLGE